MKLILLTIFSFLLVGNNGSANTHFPITNEDKKTLVLGKVLYEKNCASCHAINLSGAKNWKEGKDEDGQRLPPPLNGTGHTWHHSDKLLHGIIKNGLTYYIQDYKGKMGAFGDVLNDKEIDSVLAYIKSYWNKDNYEHQIKLQN